jgi:hypothetical protein
MEPLASRLSESRMVMRLGKWLYSVPDVKQNFQELKTVLKEIHASSSSSSINNGKLVVASSQNSLVNAYLSRLLMATTRTANSMLSFVADIIDDLCWMVKVKVLPPSVAENWETFGKKLWFVTCVIEIVFNLKGWKELRDKIRQTHQRYLSVLEQLNNSSNSKNNKKLSSDVVDEPAIILSNDSCSTSSTSTSTSTIVSTTSSPSPSPSSAVVVVEAAGAQSPEGASSPTKSSTPTELKPAELAFLESQKTELEATLKQLLGNEFMSLVTLFKFLGDLGAASDGAFHLDAPKLFVLLSNLLSGGCSMYKLYVKAASEV